MPNGLIQTLSCRGSFHFKWSSKKLRPRPNQIFDSPVETGKAVEKIDIPRAFFLYLSADFPGKIKQKTINPADAKIQIQLMKLMKIVFRFLCFVGIFQQSCC